MKDNAQTREHATLLKALVRYVFIVYMPFLRNIIIFMYIKFDNNMFNSSFA